MFSAAHFRMARFGAVGALAAAVYTITTFASELFSGSIILSSLLGYLIAAAVSFTGQRVITFQSKGRIRRELPLFLIHSALGLPLSIAVPEVLSVQMGLSPPISITAVALTTAGINYFVMKKLIFVSTPSRKDRQTSLTRLQAEDNGLA